MNEEDITEHLYLKKMLKANNLMWWVGFYGLDFNLNKVHKKSGWLLFAIKQVYVPNMYKASIGT